MGGGGGGAAACDGEAARDGLPCHAGHAKKVRKALKRPELGRIEEHEPRGSGVCEELPPAHNCAVLRGRMARIRASKTCVHYDKAVHKQMHGIELAFTGYTVRL